MIFKKKNRSNFRKIAFLLTTSALLAMELYFAYHMKVIDVLYMKIVISEEKIVFENFGPKFSKTLFAYFYIIIDSKIISYHTM